MSSQPNARIGRRYATRMSAGIVERQLTSYSVQMISQDVSLWKAAVNAAWSVLNPDRRQLIQMYENLRIDGHTDAVIEKRVLAITNKKVEFYLKDKEGETPDNIREFITGAPWFQDFLREAMMAVAYGFSLIELVPRGGFVQEVNSINREHVIPERDFLVWDKYIRNEGINYLTDPKYSKYLINVGKANDYGKLMVASQYIIYKRGGFADWSQFAELYGMPIKVGKYDPYDELERARLSEAFNTMGANASIVMPKGAEIELMDTSSQGKSEIFRDMIELCNSEISKTFLGQTLTTDPGRNGARSLGDIHKEVEEGINLADSIRMEYLLNWILVEKLQAIGYEIPEGRFVFPQTVDLPLDQRIKIDVEVAKQVAISDEYWYNTYGVERAEVDKLVKDPEPPEVDPDEPDDPKKPKPPTPRKKKADTKDPDADPDAPVTKKPKEKEPPKKPSSLESDASFQAEVTELYSHSCEDCDHDHDVVMAVDQFDQIWNDLAEQIYQGNIPLTDERLIRATADKLVEAVTQLDIADDLPVIASETMLNNLRKNVQVFSGFKTYQQLKEASGMLVGSDGALRSFSEFRKLVKEVSDRYNDSWLRTEYNHAVASADMAANWEAMNATKDTFGSLTYLTAKDERVRNSHAVLEGVTRPIDDGFWSSYYPPNGWGCRCTVMQSDARATPTSKIQYPDIPPMFQGNVAKDGGVIFPESHPFFKVQKEHKTVVIAELDRIFVNQAPLKVAKKAAPKAPAGRHPMQPAALDNYPIKISPKLWDQFDEVVPFETHGKRGPAYYSPLDNTVVIDTSQGRFKRSEWHRQAVLYHEYGHALHHTRKWITKNVEVDQRVKHAFAEAQKTIKVGKAGAVEARTALDRKLKAAWYDQDAHLEFNVERNDFDEMMASTMDTLNALTKGKAGWGHANVYWSRPLSAEKEFFAHAMENHFIDNPVMAKYMPEVYQLTLTMIKELFKDKP